MKTKKEFLSVKILVHPYQAAIVRGLQTGMINLDSDTLRGIGAKIGLENKSTAQVIKHHLDILVRYGILQKIYGEYVYYKKKAAADKFQDIETEIQSFMDATENKMLIKGLHEALLIVGRHK